MEEQKKFDYEFKIVPLEKKGEGKERPFECRLVRKAENFQLLMPKRQLFLQFIKFAPGMGIKDYLEFYLKQVDGRCEERYGKGMTRHKKFDIHEVLTFVTLGAYDLVVLWDAPDMATFNEFLATVIEPHAGSYRNQHSPVSLMLRHQL